MHLFHGGAKGAGLARRARDGGREVKDAIGAVRARIGESGAVGLASAEDALRRAALRSVSRTAA